MNRRFFSILLLAMTVVATASAQVTRKLIVTAVNGKAEYVEKGHKHPLSKGVELNDLSLLYIPYNGSVTLIDEAASKEYTAKSIGWSSVEDKLKDAGKNVMTRTKDYVKHVVAEVSGAPKIKATYVSDPATVTREPYVKDRDFREEFEEFRDKARREYDAFRKKALTDYANFVRAAWKQMGAEPPIPEPIEEKVEPVLVADADAETASWFGDLVKRVGKGISKIVNQIDNTTKDEPKPQAAAEKKEDVELKSSQVISAPKPQKQPADDIKILQDTKNSNDYQVFSVFGTRCRIRIGENCRFKLASLSENDVSDAMKQFTQTQYDNMLYDCLKERKEKKFSDWAYYQMLVSLVNSFYGENTSEGTLVLAFLYSQSGYKMKLAHDGQRLHMLMACAHTIYNKAYFKMDGDQYYLLDGSDINTMSLCRARFETESPLSLRITYEQELGENLTVERTITSKKNPDFSFTIRSNQNYMDFYETVPSSCIGGDFMTRWAIYANTPMEQGIVKQLYPAMKKKLEGLSQADQVQQLLHWVQTGFDYAFDEDIWGADRAFFGEETLFYPFCDCEDRSILLSHLVRELVGLDVVLVYYPGHLAMAVNFTDPVKGDFFTLEGKQYTVCDPTYIPARIGDTMPTMKGKSATLILLDKREINV